MKPCLRLKRLKVARMPGLPDGLPEMLPPQADVVLVYGPNASGKTSTARAVQALLWGERQQGWTVSGRFDLEGEVLAVELDAGRTLAQLGGKEITLAVPPAEMKDRYRLGLDLFLEAEDKGLAAAVLRESSGGIDIASAAQALGFALRSPRRDSTYGALLKAREACAKLESRSRDLGAEQGELEELEHGLDRARAARDRLGALGRAVELARDRRKLAEAQAGLEEFPPAMAKVLGNELQRLEKLANDLAEKGAGERQARDDLGLAEDALRELEPPEGQPWAPPLASLRSRVEELVAAQADARRAKAGLDAARAREQSELGRLGADVDPRRLDQLDLDGLGNLDALVRRAGENRSARAGIKEQLAGLGQDREGPPLEVLHRGLGLLEQWLADPAEDAPRAPSMVLVLGCGLVLAAGAALAGALHWGFAVLALAGAAGLAWALRPGHAPSPRPQRERDFSDLALDPPQAWERGAVQERAAQLRREVASAEADRERAGLRAGLSQRLAALVQEARDLDGERREAARRLGVSLDLDEPSLYVLAEGVRRRQEAATAARAAESGLESAQQAAQFLLQRINQDLSRCAVAPVADAAQARQAVEALELRDQTLRQAHAARKDAARRLEDAAKRLDELRRETRELYLSVGLEPGDEPGLRNLCARREAWEAWTGERRDALSRIQAAEAALEAFPDILALGPDDLARELDECRDAAGDLEKLMERRESIRARVEEAKRRSEMEEALADLDRKADALRRERDRNARDACGHALARFLEEQGRESGLPLVFRQAGKLFAAITNHRFRLDFDPSGPSFRAIDTSTGLGHSLDELSGATRLHLLLAVRLAFLEEQEQGPRLPLLLDETLANSDEKRAKAVIGAALALGREGRQILYFTAQHDEAAKWERLAEERGDVRLAVLDLAALRHFDESERLPLERLPERPRPLVPAPGDMDHEAYGQALKAPGLDPSGDAGNIHLWHVVRDLDLLHELLRRDITRLGQLRNYLEMGGLGDAPRDSLDRAMAAARLLEALFRLWRQGRGRPVTRQALVDGGVSDTFIDQVTELAQELGGDARLLLEALEKGRVKRFQSSVRDRLQERLAQDGFLDERDVLDRDRLRLRALAEVDPDVSARLVDPALADAFLARLPD